MVDAVTASGRRHREVRSETADHASATAEFAAVAADSRTVALWTLVSRITGFGRVAAMAAVLGPTYFGNLFQTANYLPFVVHEVLTGSLVTAMLVPPLIRLVDAQDRGAVSRLANGFLGVTLLAFLAVVMLSVLAAPALVDLITIGVADPAVRARQHDLGWPLLAMLMPQVLFYGVAATGMAVQHAHRRFALAAAAPAFENIGVMTVMATSALLFGVGTTLEEITTPQLMLLGLGATAAAGLHAAAQWWGAYRVGVTLRPIAGWADHEVRRLLRLAVASSGYAALNAGNYLGLLVAAGSVPGGTVAFQIGTNFFMLPVAICAKPVATAQLPQLARSFNQQAYQKFQATYRNSLALTLFVVLPVAVLFVGVPELMAKAVSFGEMATTVGIGLVTVSIASLGAGIVGEAAFRLSTSASYARRDAAAPFAAMVLRSAITFAGIALAIGAMSDLAVLWTLGLGFSTATILAALYLHWRQMRALPPPRAARRWAWVGDLAISLVALVPSLLVAHWLDGAVHGGLAQVIVGLAAIGLSISAYLAIQWIRGSAELGMLFAGIGRPTAGPVPAREASGGHP